MYYEVYINKTGTETPTNFFGIVNVLDEDSDLLIIKWCEKSFGQKYKVFNHDIKEAWRFMPISDAKDDKIVTTIKRKTVDAI